MCQLLVNTDRLSLVCSNSAILQADWGGPIALSNHLHVSMPSTWPPELGASLWKVQYIPEWLNDIGRNPSSLGWHVWYIIQAKERHLIGAMWFIVEESSGERELWIELSREHQRDGYGPEALQGFLDWAFNSYGASHVAFRTSKRNVCHLSKIYAVEVGEENEETGIIQARILR